jgi:hypothetical protein
MSLTVVTTPDTILEVPDETVTMVMSSPGLFPSVLGRLWATFTIVDNGNGYVQNTTDYTKLYMQGSSNYDSIGYDVSLDISVGAMVSGSPQSSVAGAPPKYVAKLSAGNAVLYRLYKNRWIQARLLTSPQPVANGRFGDAVKIGRIFLRNTCLLVIGEPGQNAVHVYVSQVNDATSQALGATFTYETKLQSSLETHGQDRFGARGTIGLNNDIIVVGSPGLETVFIFCRKYNSALKKWVWSSGTLMRSSDYDYDIMWGTPRLHRMEFGRSVAVSERTFVVGAPYADYDKSGSNLVEINVDTEGESIHSYGRGRAYVFYITPAVQLVQLLPGPVTFRR